MNKIMKMLGKHDTMEVDKDEMITEHERLINILEKADKEECAKEAMKQKMELTKLKKN